jgi:hypothetical protein
VVSTPVAGFRDSRDPHVRVAPAPDFPAAVRDTLPASTRFPEGTDVPMAGWDDRAVAMRAVIDGMLRP